MHTFSRVISVSIALMYLLSGCASTKLDPPSPFDAARQLLTTDIYQSDPDNFIQELYDSRGWVPYKTLENDPVDLGVSLETPIQDARMKLVGPSREDALRSLALKIWMIENADHTIDAVYYIFSSDWVGQSILGALCNAVERGVDVRVMVDSIGSLSLSTTDLAALATCGDQAEYMTGLSGETTGLKARIQVVVFNAFSNPISRVNRRSHDKLLIVDGAFPEKAMVLTGGRNISAAYHGIQSDGSDDPDVYHDLEIFLRPLPPYELPSVGNVSETYFTLLFLNKGNKRVYPSYPGTTELAAELNANRYQRRRNNVLAQHDRVRNLPILEEPFNDMPGYTGSGFHDSEVKLAHELANLTDSNVVREAVANRQGNPDSIMNIIQEPREISEDASVRIVSPYLFLSRYLDREGNMVEDSVKNIHRWLDENPNGRLEIITNSVMTSDNIFTQSVIDMEVGPRLLLDSEFKDAWLSGLAKGEFNPEVTGTEHWRDLVDHPQIFLYQTGRLDAAMLGQGDQHYGKLHAKFLAGAESGFVGTSNFDYRSILFNNEMGFFFNDQGALEELNIIFEDLRAVSYRWGSPEWLEMRQLMMESGGMKAWGTRNQRSIYKILKNTGLIWQF